MPLRKPSEFFDDKNKKSPLDVTKEELKNAAPENLETISEAYGSFKTNLNQVQKLSSFTESLEDFKFGLEKVNSLTEVVDQIEAEIKDLVKKEDLDEAIMAQLFFVEESLNKTQTRIKTLNSKTLVSVKEDFDNLSTLVNNFLSAEVPTYKKLIKDSERRVDDRFVSYKESINLEIEDINLKISKKFEGIAKTLRGINEENLKSIRGDISDVDSKISSLVEEELPKYKKLFAETELKTEKRLSETERKIQEKSESFELDYLNRVNKIEENLNQFIDLELPKFKNSLVEFKLNTEDKINVVSKDLDENILRINEGFNALKESVKNENLQSKEVLEKNILQIENFVSGSKDEISSLTKTYESLYKDFKNREIHESKKLSEYSDRIDEISDKVSDLESSVSNEVFEIKENVDTVTSNYYEVVKNKVDAFENSILEKVKDIEINFVRNESHIESIKESLQETLSKIQLDAIEKNNNKISQKIEYLESLLETFNEKTILKEDGSLLTGTESTKTQDPLTPLDKKFVTFDDLSSHYRQFINRVQLQLASIGGGGAGFIKDLDDVSFDQTAGNNQLLIYNQSSSKWVGIASTAIGGNIGIQSAGTLIKDNVRVLNFIGLGNTFSVNGDVVDISISAGAGGTWAATSAGIHTTKNVGIATTARSDYSLYVEGDGYFTGNISVGGTITYEDVTNVDSIGIVTARSGVRINDGGLVVTSGISTLGILTASDVYSTGIVTASGFVGDVTGNLTGNADTATYASSAGIATYSDSAGISTYASSAGIATYSDSAGISTVSQGLTGSPDITIGNLTVNNDAGISGNIYQTGIATFGASNGIGTVTVGVGSTALYVDGNARVVGVLTVGRASVTIDGDNNTITSGIVTITNSTIVLGDNITISGSAAGINSAPNVIYVAKDGNDSNNGTSIEMRF